MCPSSDTLPYQSPYGNVGRLPHVTASSGGNVRHSIARYQINPFFSNRYGNGNVGNISNVQEREVCIQEKNLDKNIEIDAREYREVTKVTRGYHLSICLYLKELTGNLLGNLNHL